MHTHAKANLVAQFWNNATTTLSCVGMSSSVVLADEFDEVSLRVSTTFPVWTATISRDDKFGKLVVYGEGSLNAGPLSRIA